eukprot:5195909-Pleurochrysis_carterae.AAC.2
MAAPRQSSHQRSHTPRRGQRRVLSATGVSCGAWIACAMMTWAAAAVAAASATGILAAQECPQTPRSAQTNLIVVGIAASG